MRTFFSQFCVKLFRDRSAKSLTQNRQSTQATMDETETNSMHVDAYHVATRLHTVDILAGIMPRLRVNPAKQHSEPKPLSLRTRKRMTREICTVYGGAALVGKVLVQQRCDSCRPALHTASG